MPEITRTEKTFTYDLPDAYLYLTNDLGKTGQWTYKGPDKLWIFIDNQTKKVISRFHYTEQDNGADVPTPIGQTKVLVDANVEPLLASIIHNEYDYSQLPQHTETLPDGNTYSHPDPQSPDHTYEITEIEYDIEKQEFIKPLPWKKPHVSWDDLKKWRNQQLDLSDAKIRSCRVEMIPAWEEYRQKLRDLPSLMEGVDPWKVIFPDAPDMPPPQPTFGA